MTQDEIDTARFKNLLICGWIGVIYGTGAAVVADVNWSVILFIVLLAAGSSYLNVGRKLLE